MRLNQSWDFLFSDYLFDFNSHLPFVRLHRRLNMAFPNVVVVVIIFMNCIVFVLVTSVFIVVVVVVVFSGDDGRLEDMNGDQFLGATSVKKKQ